MRQSSVLTHSFASRLCPGESPLWLDGSMRGVWDSNVGDRTLAHLRTALDGNGEPVRTFAQNSGSRKNHFPVRYLGKVVRTLRAIGAPIAGGNLATTSTCFDVHLGSPRSDPPPDGYGGFPMLAFVRAAIAAALVLLLSIPTIAADKPF